MGNEADSVELSQLYLNNLQEELSYSEDQSLNKYFVKDGDIQLAKDLGDSLELVDSVRAEYIIENSYNDLYNEVYFEKGLNEGEWKGYVVEGMGEHHLDLQGKYQNDRSLKSKVGEQVQERE